MLLFLELLLVFFFALFASILASFFAVVIYRTAHEQSFIKGRSECELCHKQIAWYDNVPIFSFLKLKGKCRHCHKKIDRSYFVAELLSFVFALIFALLNVFTPIFYGINPMELAIYFLFIFIMAFAFWSDIKYLIVPDFFVVLLFVLAAIYLYVVNANLLLALAAVAFSTLFFSALSFFAAKILKKPALGDADIKLMVPIAMILSWPLVTLSIFLAFIIGGFFAMLSLITKKKKIGQALPFAPFLILAALVTFLFGRAIWTWYFSLIIA